MAVNLPILDSLAGADANPLDGPWTAATAWWGADPLRRISNRGAGQPGPAYNGASVYTGSQFTAPFIISSVIDVLPPADGDNSYNYEFYTTSPAVDATPDGYDVILRGGGGDYDVEIWLVQGGAYTAMNGLVGADVQAGDQLAVRYLQNLLSVWRVRAGVWTELVNTNAADPIFPVQYLGPFYVTIGIVDSVGATPGVTRFSNVAGAALATVSRGYPTKASPEENVVAPSPHTWNAPFPWGERRQTYVIASSKTNGGVQQSVQYNTNQQGGWTVLHNRFMSRPLAAQAIGGTFNLCAYVQAVWVDPVLSPSNDSVVRFRVRVYLTAGQTATVRTLLLDYTDSVDWPGVGAAAWRSLASAQALAAATAQDGDSIMIEFGAIVVSSPTPAYGYPPPIPPGQNYTSAPFAFLGTTNSSNVNLADATAGSTTLALAPWVDFSQALVELPAGAPPANDACADAVVIAALPYTSPRISTSYAAGTQKEVWYVHTFAASGRVAIAAWGSNYLVQLDAGFVFGSPACSNIDFELPVERLERLVGTTQSVGIWEVTAGQTWYFRVRTKVPTSTDNGARESGGSLLLRLFMVEPPQADDLILPCGSVVVYREGQPVALTSAYFSLFPSGVAIDYTGRSMNSQSGGTSTGWRLLIGEFGVDLVQILELPTLSVGTAGVDSIADPLETPLSPGVQVRKHPSRLAVSAAGQLYVGLFGNGFQFVDGYGPDVPSQLNTVPSDLSLYGGIRSLSATAGDNQPGAPFTATVLTGTAEVTNPWGIALQDPAGVLYYTSGSLYVPLGGQQVRRISVGGTQLALFATLTPTVGTNPGVRGLYVFTDGSALVCNGTTVQRFTASGTLAGTYTPSIPTLARVLMDVQVTANGQNAWVVDLGTNTLWKFRLSDMTELAHYETDLLPGTLTQMAIVQPVLPPPPPGTSEGCPDTLGVTAVSGLAGCPTVLGETEVSGLTGCRVTLPTG